MPLDSGVRLGPYEIVTAIGAGGMGEVYLGRDPRFGRDIALKVLPAAFSSDPDRIQRFEQEARAAAALNHPNILATFDIGRHDGASYIVSELLDGETLRDRLGSSGLPLRKAVEYAIQIARGLSAAHAKGIVHRDLKPENVFVTSDGRVKILDFGLAKLTQTESASAGVTALPTTPPQTMPGIVLGTVGYMAPEQVRGLAADHRSDIFAFGTILYESLSGRRAFTGETTMDAMTAILKEDPPDLPIDERRIPPALARIVDRCLEKNPDVRFQSAGDLAFALEGLSSAAGAAELPAAPAERVTTTIARELIAWTAAVHAAFLTASSILFFTRPQPEQPAAIRFDVPPPEGMSLGTGMAAPQQAVSPDGRRIVFSVQKGDVNQLAVRSLDALDVEIVPGTEFAAAGQGGTALPFWSHDSRSIGYFSQGKLKRVEIAGGRPQTLCDAPLGEGGTWNSDGTILFSPAGTGGLSRVSANGGTPVPVTTLDEAKGERSHRHPSFLPDGRHFLFVVQKGMASAAFLGSLDSTDRVELFATDSKVHYANGHVLFIRGGTLFAQPFDAGRLRTTADPFPVAEDVGVNSAVARAAFSATDSGVLAYRSNMIGSMTQLAWFDRSGARVALVGQPAFQIAGMLSPDGLRAAVVVRDPGRPTTDIWIYDVERGTPTRLTTDAANEGSPAWSPDGNRIAYFSDRSGHRELYTKAVSGLGAEERLFADGTIDITPTSWSSDSRFILFSRGPQTDADVWALPLEGDRKAVPVVEGPASQYMAQWSPDGRWIAYSSSESAGAARADVYVVPFPGPGDRVRVSPEGGTSVRWRRDGKELFYAVLGTMSVASVSGAGSRFEVLETKRLMTMP